MKNKNAMSRNGRRIGTKTKTTKIRNVEAYYKRFRNGKNRHNQPFFDEWKAEQQERFVKA